MEPLRVHLFGYPRVESSAGAVPISRRKAVALLAYLAVTGVHHSRDALATLLWPDSEPSKGYAFLRNALWVLHQTPLSEALIATRHMVGLRMDPSLWVDVVSFRERLDPCRSHTHPGQRLCEQGAEQLRGAIDLHREGFLTGFAVDDSWSFEEWQLGESARLSDELGATLEALIAYHEARREPGAALSYAQRLLALRPIHEDVHRVVIRLRAESGDRAGAWRQYEECERVLVAELGLAPSEETRELADTARRGKGAGPAAGRSDPDNAGCDDLPKYCTPLVGRGDEVSRLLELLVQPSCRVLTITGAGGSGKTRLAVEVARRSMPKFSEGPAFVPLTSVEDPGLVPAAILEAMGEQLSHSAPSEGSTASDELAGLLQGRKLLIVLDSFEHLVRDVRWLRGAVGRTDGVRFLITSRQQLDLAEEWVYPIEGLPFPDDAAAASPAAYPAVQLFLQTAKRSDARFAPSADDLAAVARIVRLLHGLPLGIELAAPWVRTMTCAAIADEIGRSLDFLNTQGRLVPRRHRSLRAAFEGSWALLDRRSRVAFRALSVFRGSFSIEAAQRVAGTELPVIAALIGKSLLKRTGATRFEMLEIVRQFGAERLRALPDEYAALERRHADYYLTLLASQEPRLKGPEQKDALVLLGQEAANVYAAWRKAIAEGRFDRLSQSTMGLFLLCDMTTRFSEGLELFREAADAARTTARPSVYGYLRGIHAWFEHFHDPIASERLFGDSCEALDEGPRDRDRAFIHVLLAYCGHATPKLTREELEEDVEGFQEHGNRWEYAAGSEALAGYTASTSPQMALEAVERSLEVRSAIGDGWGMALATFALATCHLRQGRLDEARVEFLESAAIRRSLDIDPFGVMGCLSHVGEIDRRLGRLADAAKRYQEALEIASRVHHRRSAAECHLALAEIAREAGRIEDAEAHARVAIETYEACPAATGRRRCRELLRDIAPRPADGG